MESKQDPPKATEDLRDQVAALLALMFKQQTEKKDSPNKKIGQGITIAAAITALIAAFGSLTASVQSLYVSTQASETQRQITERQEQITERQEQITQRQKELEIRDRRISENARISNLWVFYDKTCAPIPADDSENWDLYTQCLSGTAAAEERVFSSVEDSTRLRCLNMMERCK